MERRFFIWSGFFGALAVGFGAFGAHGLRNFFAALPDGAERRAVWETASHYHLVHALALAFAGVLAGRTKSTAATISGLAFAAGIALFSGSLYALALTGVRALGAITPLGGLLLIAGWVAAAIAAFAIR